MVEFSSVDGENNVIRVTNNPSNELNGLPLNDNDRRSSIVDILLISSDTGVPIQPQNSLEVCIRTESAQDGLCLSSYSSLSGKWECDDYCLSVRDEEEDSLLCGKVDHLTNFALFFVGGEKVKQECENSLYASDAYIFANAKQDIILISCVCLLAVLIVLVGWSMICIRGEWKKRLRLRDMTRVVVVYNSDHR